MFGKPSEFVADQLLAELNTAIAAKKAKAKSGDFGLDEGKTNPDIKITAALKGVSGGLKKVVGFIDDATAAKILETLGEVYKLYYNQGEGKEQKEVAKEIMNAIYEKNSIAKESWREKFEENKNSEDFFHYGDAMLVLISSYNSAQYEQLKIGLEGMNGVYDRANAYMHSMQEGVISTKATEMISSLRTDVRSINLLIGRFEKLGGHELSSAIKTVIETLKQLVVGCEIAMREATVIAAKEDDELHKCSSAGVMKFKAVMKAIGLSIVAAISAFTASATAAAAAAIKDAKKEVNSFTLADDKSKEAFKGRLVLQR